MTIARYAISMFIGPCGEKECEDLMDAIIDLPEFAAVHGGAVSCKAVADDDPLFADA